MRDDVCIVLNEREPLKSQMAAELSDQLRLRSISCTSLKPSANLGAILAERIPKVLVLDFVLGDVATALDILTELDSYVSSNRMAVLLWTDEQSIQVAVNAMKLGASDFIGLADTRSMEKILHAIEAGLQTSASDQPVRTRQTRSFQQPTGQSQAYRETLAVAQAQGKANAAITILLGPPGSGRDTLAQLIHYHRPKAGSYLSLDFGLWPGETAEIVGSKEKTTGVPMLSHAATVFIDHVEHDTEELIEAVASQKDMVWGSSEASGDSPSLIVGTVCPDTARSWQRLFQCTQITVPSLADRVDDVLPLFQSLYEMTLAKGKHSKPRLSAQGLSQLVKLDWPGNVRQFRAAVVEALSLPDDYISAVYEQAGSIPELNIAELSSAEQKLVIAIAGAKQRWEKFSNIEAFVPAPLAARRVLESSNGNIRIAAAKIGTGVPQLRSALRGVHQQQPR